MTVLIR